MTREQQLEAALVECRDYLTFYLVNFPHPGVKEAIRKAAAALAAPATAQGVDVASWEAGRDAAKHFVIVATGHVGLAAAIAELTPPAPEVTP
jgi:hypothetical protein